MSSTSGMIVYLVFIIAIFYFMAIRPQSKEKKKQAELMATVAVGDSVLTSSGFYGVIIDMTDDTVIDDLHVDLHLVPFQQHHVRSGRGSCPDARCAGCPDLLCDAALVGWFDVHRLHADDCRLLNQRDDRYLRPYP